MERRPHRPRPVAQTRGGRGSSQGFAASSVALVRYAARLERRDAAVAAVGAERVGEVWGRRAETALDLEDQC
eukprot:4447816-Alexandrium_andersonii.AAC.1